MPCWCERPLVALLQERMQDFKNSEPSDNRLKFVPVAGEDGQAHSGGKAECHR